jgi:hypothetical protein
MSRHFYRTPPPRASDGRAIVSRKDDGGSCSQVLSTSLATLHAQSKAKVDPVRRLCGNMAPRIDPGARAAARSPWRDVIPKLGPLQQDLSRRARSEKATCRWNSGGETTPAASKREAGPLASGGAAEEGLRATTAHRRSRAPLPRPPRAEIQGERGDWGGRNRPKVSRRRRNVLPRAYLSRMCWPEQREERR